ncbi:MAG: TIR domain-containing protein [Planctomycetota bacterium]
MAEIATGVFVCYRRASAWLARTVAQDLESYGFDVFLDIDRLDSGFFDETLLLEIGQRPHFVVILTPGSLVRCVSPEDWLRREIEHALQSRRNVVPIFADGFRFEMSNVVLPSTLAELPRFNGLTLSNETFRPTMDLLRQRFLRRRQPIAADAHEQRLDELWRRLSTSAGEHFTALWQRLLPRGPTLDDVQQVLRRSLTLADPDPYPLVEGLLLAFERNVTELVDLTSRFNGLWASLEGYLAWLLNAVDGKSRGQGPHSGLAEILQRLGLGRDAERLPGLDGEVMRRAIQDVRAFRNHYLHGGARPDGVHVAQGCRAALLTLWLAVATRHAALEAALRAALTSSPTADFAGAAAVVVPEVANSTSALTPEHSRDPPPVIGAEQSVAGGPPPVEVPARSSAKTPVPSSPDATPAPASTPLELEEARASLAQPRFAQRPLQERGRVFSSLVVHLGYARAVPELIGLGFARKTIVRGLVAAGHDAAAKRVQRVAETDIAAAAGATATESVPAGQTPAGPAIDAAKDPEIQADARHDGHSLLELITQVGYQRAVEFFDAAGLTESDVDEALQAIQSADAAKRCAKERARLEARRSDPTRIDPTPGTPGSPTATIPAALATNAAETLHRLDRVEQRGELLRIVIARVGHQRAAEFFDRAELPANSVCEALESVGQSGMAKRSSKERAKFLAARTTPPKTASTPDGVAALRRIAAIVANQQVHHGDAATRGAAYRKVIQSLGHARAAELFAQAQIAPAEVHDALMAAKEPTMARRSLQQRGDTAASAPAGPAAAHAPEPTPVADAAPTPAAARRVAARRGIAARDAPALPEPATPTAPAASAPAPPARPGLLRRLLGFGS